MRRPLATTSLLLAATIAAVVAVPAARAEVVDAADALAHVGSSVTIEGDVAVARSDSEGLVLELAPVGEKSFRAVLVRSLISSLPRAPERIYEGKRVRVTGIVQRFQGRPEMVLESASQIEIVDIAGAPATSTTSVPAPVPVPTTLRPAAPLAPGPTVTAPAPAATPPATAPPAATPPASVTAAPPAVTPPPAPRAATPPAPSPTPAPAPPATVAPSEPAPKPMLAERLAQQACDRARARWTEAAERARAAAQELTRCLDTASYACRESAAKLAPALGDLEWAEQQVADQCD
jgi:hypothetical protein